jgi:hypothetical protein
VQRCKKKERNEVFRVEKRGRVGEWAEGDEIREMFNKRLKIWVGIAMWHAQMTVLHTDLLIIPSICLYYHP